MRKILYWGAVPWCLLAMVGCYPLEKQAVAPAPGYQRQAQTAGNGQAAGGGAASGSAGKTVPKPAYLDISDQGTPTIKEVTTENEAPSMEYVDSRIAAYGKKLAHWRDLDDQSLVLNLSQEETERMVNCFRDLQKVLNGYGVLRSDLLRQQGQGTATPMAGITLRDLQREDIAFLESPCGSMLAGKGQKAGGMEKEEQQANLPQLEALIGRYAAHQQYEEVVQVWLQIAPSQTDNVDLRTRLRYANALMYLHQGEKAAQMYQKIVDWMSSDRRAVDRSRCLAQEARGSLCRVRQLYSGGRPIPENNR